MAARETLTIEVRSDGTRVVKRELSEIGTSARGATDGVFMLRRALRTLGIAAIAREFLKLSDSYTNITNRLAVVTSSTQELRAVMDELFGISRRTRTAFEQNAELYNRLALATRGFGLSQRDLLDVMETLNKAVISSGAGAREANNAMIQLSQGLASGRLNGDELRSVLEQLPVVADIIAKELGVTRGQLRELGREGKITTDVIIRAFQNAREEIEERFGKTIPTLGQSFTILRNALMRWVGDMNSGVGLTSALATLVILLADNFDTLMNVVVATGAALMVAFAPRGIGAAIAYTTAQVNKLTLALARNPIGAIAVAVTFLITLLFQLRYQIKLTKDGVGTLGDYVKAMMETAKAAIGSLVDMLRRVTAPLDDIRKKIFGAVDFDLADVMLATARGLDYVVGLFRGAVLSIIVIWNQLPAAMIDTFISAINQCIFAVRDFVLKTGLAIAQLPGTIVRVFSNIGVSIYTTLSNIPQMLMSIFQSAVVGIAELFSNLVLNLSNFLPNAMSAIGQGAMQAITAPFVLGLALIQAHWNRLPGWMKDAIITGANLVIGAMEELVNSIIRALARAGVAVVALGTAFSDFVVSLKSIPDAIGEIFRAAMERAKSRVVSGINAIIGMWNRLPGFDLPLIPQTTADEAIRSLGNVEISVVNVVNRFKELQAQGNAAIAGLDPVQLGRIANQYEGEAQRLVDNIERIITKGFDNPFAGASENMIASLRSEFMRGLEAGGPFAEGVQKWLDRAEELARERINQSQFDLTTPGALSPVPSDAGPAGKPQKELKTKEKEYETLADINAELLREYQLLQLVGRERTIQARLFEMEDRLKRNNIELNDQEQAQLEERIRSLENLRLLSETISNVVGTVFDAIGSNLADFIRTGELNIREFVINMIAELGRIAAMDLVLTPIAEGITGMLTRSLGNSMSGAAGAFGDLLGGADDAAGAAALTGSATLLSTAGGLLSTAGGTLSAGGASILAGGTSLTAAAASLAASAAALTSAAASTIGNGFIKGLPGFATGGSFEVGGRGGVDNNLVAFRATRGERVDILTPDQQRGGGNTIVFNITTPDVQGFKNSEPQLAARAARLIGRGGRNL